jgi:NADH-quinone oxidoreductase subunit E
MGQIGKDYYEDLSVEALSGILDRLEAGEVPRPGSQVGRFASEPEGGVTSLAEWVEGREAHNASVTLALSLGDTVKRIDGTETPLLAPWLRTPRPEEPEPVPYEEARTETPPDGEQGEAPRSEDLEHVGRPPGVRQPLPDGTTSAPEPQTEGMDPVHGAGASNMDPTPTAETVTPEQAPVTLTAPRPEGADDLRRIAGVDERLAQVLNELGFFHFDQIADWGAAEVSWVNSRLGDYRGVIERDDLIAQARRLAGRE